MRAGRHRAARSAEDLAAGVVALSTEDLDLLRAGAVAEAAALARTEELLEGRLDLARGEANRRGMAVPADTRPADEAGTRSPDHGAVHAGGALAARSDAEIRAAVAVIAGHLRDVRADLAHVRGLARVADDERSRRHD